VLLCCHAAQPISPTAAPALTAPLPLLRRLRSGTSQSVPFVAGVMALILQNATGTPPANMQRLLAASAAANKLGEVAGSGFSSLAQVRLVWPLGIALLMDAARTAALVSVLAVPPLLKR
jgi:hypothetical protein